MDRRQFFDFRNGRQVERINQNSSRNSNRSNNSRYPFGSLNQNYAQNHNYNDFSRDPFGMDSLRGSSSAPPPRFQQSLTPPGSEKSFVSSLASQFTCHSSDSRREPLRTSTPSSSSFLSSFQNLSVSHGNNNARYSLLPAAALDENGDIRADLNIQTVVEEGLLMIFAMDKAGCHFLQSNFFGPECTGHFDEYTRTKIYSDVLSSSERFYVLATNIFGNFFLQRVIEQSRSQEQDVIRKYFSANIAEYCLDKSGCRVIQTAIDKMRPRIVDQLVDSLPRDGQLMTICTDQNANHVIQKVIKKLPLEKWEFVVSFLCSQDHLVAVSQDKYGCRVVQTVIEVLTNGCAENVEYMMVLRRIMARVLMECKRLTSNEFANYVIQHVIETPGVLAEYRDIIIQKCLLRSLLSMSQEKYASHVVERAFTFAPLPILSEMMDEIFDGYLPHPETGKDALDILIFHQFGNYVVQRMLQICCHSVLGDRSTIINGQDCRYKFEIWLNKLAQRAKKEKTRLTRFSSGKKILDILETMKTPYDLDRRPRVFYHPHSSGAFFSPSTTNSVTSEDVRPDLEHLEKTDGAFFSKF